MKDMKISTRLIIGFGLMSLLIVGLGGIALWESASLKESFSLTTHQRVPIIMALNKIENQVSDIGIALRESALMEQESDHEMQKKKIISLREKIESDFKKLNATVKNPKAKELLGRILMQRGKYIDGQNKVLEMIDAGHAADAGQYLVKELRPVLSGFGDAIKELQNYQAELLDQSSEAAHHDISAIQEAVWISIAVALLIAVLLATWIIRAITRPLREAVLVAEAVAAGNLTVHVDVSGKSETAQLLKALDRMLESLRKVVGQVRDGSGSVASASSQIAQANMDLSSRTEEQASALEETAASMEQLNSTVRQNADNAQQANQLAKSASEVAERGGNAVGGAVQTMQGINESSRKIADIIGVIDSIAFQTNILALNAAVEAARAGEQGRGFAVVASEVRTLAGRSAEAAKEIKVLITDSVQRIESGTTQVNTAGETMKEVVQAIHRVTDLMSEISAASHEQSQGVGQVGEAVSQMDQVTQQNASLVEEMAAAAASLESQAQELVQAVQVFRLEEGQGAGVPRPQVAAAQVSEPALGSAIAQKNASRRLIA